MLLQQQETVTSGSDMAAQNTSPSNTSPLPFSPILCHHSHSQHAPGQTDTTDDITNDVLTSPSAAACDGGRRWLMSSVTYQPAAHPSPVVPTSLTDTQLHHRKYLTTGSTIYIHRRRPQQLQDLTGVYRRLQELTGAVMSLQEHSGSSGGFMAPQESSGVIRSLQENLEALRILPEALEAFRNLKEASGT